MLKLASEFGTDFRVVLFISGYMAYDAETGVYMRRSHGSRKQGRPCRYFLGGVDRRGMRPEQLAVWSEPPRAWAENLPPRETWPHITAGSDELAVSKANEWIEGNLKGSSPGGPAGGAQG